MCIICVVLEMFCKHPDLFRKSNLHLIVELGMCENTFIGCDHFRAFRPGSRLRRTRHVVRHGHFTLKQLILPVLYEMHTNSYTGPRLKRSIKIKFLSMCGVVVTTLVFLDRRPGFKLWSDLYSRSLNK